MAKKLWQSAALNQMQYRLYYEWIEEMAVSVYRWQGLPTEIDVRFLETTLFERALSIFFHDEEYDAYFACMGTPSGTVNMYNNPTSFLAYGANGFHRELKAAECVPIWGNVLRRPCIDAVQLYARRLADIDRTIDVNLHAQKMPIIVFCPESQKQTVKNLMKQYDGNEPVIMAVDGMFDVSQMSYLSSGAPYVVDKLLHDKASIWAECMTYFGIDNTNVSKAERVQSAEVRANDGQIEANRLIRLNVRREACKEINRKFGLEVWCDFNEDLSTEAYRAAYLGKVEPVTDESARGDGSFRNGGASDDTETDAESNTAE